MLAYFQTLKKVAHQLSFKLISFFSVCWWSALMNIHTISVELGVSGFWKNRWGCCSRMSKCFCPRGTAVDSQSPCWAQDNHSDYQSKRFFGPWGVFQVEFYGRLYQRALEVLCESSHTSLLLLLLPLAPATWISCTESHPDLQRRRANLIRGISPCPTSGEELHC